MRNRWRRRLRHTVAIKLDPLDAEASTHLHPMIVAAVRGSDGVRNGLRERYQQHREQRDPGGKSITKTAYFHCQMIIANFWLICNSSSKSMRSLIVFCANSWHARALMVLASWRCMLGEALWYWRWGRCWRAFACGRAEKFLV